jgi:CheY-like chemotaxis protein
MALTKKCSSQSKCFVLIAEDDEDDRSLYEGILRGVAEAVDFKFVENGRELINYLNTQDSPPDLILLDLNMPLMDGRDALKVIHSDPKFKDIPVVCLTTSSSKEDRRFCGGLGAAFYTKPARMSEFCALVRSQIGMS